MLPGESDMDTLGRMREEFCACQTYDYDCRFDVEQKTHEIFDDKAIEILSWENPHEFREIMDSYSECGAPWKAPRAAPAEMPISP